MKYKKGYKYVLQETLTENIPITGIEANVSGWLHLNKSGVLAISAGYAWDGATGAIDTPSIMRGALIHDALYQLIREKEVPESYRKVADTELYNRMVAANAWKFRALYVYWAVRLFGQRAIRHTSPLIEVN